MTEDIKRLIFGIVMATAVLFSSSFLYWIMHRIPSLMPYKILLIALAAVLLAIFMVWLLERLRR